MFQGCGEGSSKGEALDWTGGGRDVLACSLSMRPIVKLNVQRDRMGSDQRRILYGFLNVPNVVAETETCWRQSFPYAAIRNVSGGCRILMSLYEHLSVSGMNRAIGLDCLDLIWADLIWI